MEIRIDGHMYSIAHTFREGRVVIDYEGLFCLADQNPDGTWDLSGEPARDGEEKEVLKKLTAPMEGKSILTVTKE